MAGDTSYGTDGGVAEGVGSGRRGAGVSSFDGGGEGGRGGAVVVAGCSGYVVV